MHDVILALAASPWILLLTYTLCTLDGVFPPFPSESVVIGLAALSATGTGPPMAALFAVAAAGALSGDLLAYALGSRVTLQRVPLLRSPRGRATIAWAERTLDRRGLLVILGGRYIPVGRTAVNLTAGATGFPRHRFLPAAGLAAGTWALYSVALGIGAGAVLPDQPILAAVVGVSGGVLLAVLVDAAVRCVQGQRGRVPSRAVVGSKAG